MNPPSNSHTSLLKAKADSNAYKEYLDQEKEDDIILSFGKDYFNGARQGAAAGGCFTLWLCRRAFVDLRDDQKEVGDLGNAHKRFTSRYGNTAKLKPSAAAGKAAPKQKLWTVLYHGLHARPILTVGCVALALTTTMKTAKFLLANRRYQEFLIDEAEFMMLKVAAEEDPRLAKELEGAVKTLSDPSARSIYLESSPLLPQYTGNKKESATGEQPKPQALPRKSAPNADVLESLVNDLTRGPQERQLPTYWDGVGVGLLGSILDCYTPQKPVFSYYGMRCGLF